jgi:nucleoid-associated protein YgaU
MDEDYELEEDYAPRVLWGRLAIFLLALVLAFAVGRCTGGDGVSEAQYNQVRAEVQDLASENTVLRAQVEAAGQGDEGDDEPAEGNGDDEPADDEGNGGGDGDGDGGQDVGDGRTYEVQSGDTLTRIAEQFYGDPRKFDLIVDANNLDSATGLRVGQELIIPPDD